MRIGKLKKAGISLLSLFMIVGLFTSNVKTIEAVDTVEGSNGITINMFNYDAQENEYYKQYNKKEYWNQGINKDHALKFTDGDPLNIFSGEKVGNNDYNVWVGTSQQTDHFPRSGMVKNTLENGYPVLNDNTLQYKEYTYRDNNWPWQTHTETYYYTTDYEGQSLKYLFDTNSINSAKSVNTNVTGLLEKNGNHYSYDSSKKSATLNGNTISTSDWESYVTGEEKGFWPYGFSDKHFGMTMSANFTMTSNGKVNVNGTEEDMVFEFSGDDDVWVFIDGALILDIGGIHGNTNGIINFADGTVKVQNNSSYTNCGTIAELMKQAGINESYYSGNTLSKNVVHTINFFYLERGKGQSNCKLDFYLPIIKTKDITISKEVEGVNDAFKDDYNFNFSAEFTGTYANELDNIFCEKYDANDNKTDLVLSKENGKYNFTLKDGEYIILKDIVEDSTITVTENNSDEFDTTINNVSGKERSYEVSEISSIAVVNTLKNENKGDLKITKKFEGEPTNDSFNVNVKIDDKNYTGEYSIERNSGTAIDGNIEIQNEQTIVIKDIPIDKRYSVEEILTEDQNLKYLSPIYANQSGTISKNDNNVTITNQLFTGGEIQIVKSISTEIGDIDFTDGNPIFTFKIVNNDTNETYYQHIRFYEKNGKLQSTSLEALSDLEAGTYTITELSSLRYKFVNGEVCYNNATSGTSFGSSSIQVAINTSNNKATVKFKNTLKSKKYESDNGVLVNKFILSDNEDSCEVIKDKLDE